MKKIGARAGIVPPAKWHRLDAPPSRRAMDFRLTSAEVEEIADFRENRMLRATL